MGGERLGGRRAGSGARRLHGDRRLCGGAARASTDHAARCTSAPSTASQGLGDHGARSAARSSRGRSRWARRARRRRRRGSSGTVRSNHRRKVGSLTRPRRWALGLVPDECQLVVDGCLRSAGRGGCGGQPRSLGRVSEDAVEEARHPPRARLACRRRASVSTPSSAVNRAPGRPSPGRCRAPCAMAVGPAAAELHEEHQHPLLTRGELDLGTPRRRRRGSGAGSVGRLDREHGAAAEVVLDGEHAAQEGAATRARSASPEPTPRMIAPLLGGGRGEPGQEGAVLVLDARARGRRCGSPGRRRGWSRPRPGSRRG